MAGSLLDIYGNYDLAYNQYTNKYNQEAQRYQNLANQYNAALDAYLGRVDEYNKLANLYNEDLAGQQAAYQAQIDAYNASVNQDPNAYWGDGTYSGGGAYTDYNGKTIGRSNPIETYAAQPVEYGVTDEYGNPVSTTGYYDPRTGLGYNEGNFDYASENAYLDPNSGLVSIFASRPGEFNAPAFTGVNPGEFTMEVPVFNEPLAPIAPPEQKDFTSTGDIPQEQLYTKTFGRPTADVLSNEAWGLANIGTPFLSSEPTTAYETGGVAAINNPLSYVGPDSLTTGQSGVDQNSLIAGQNPYYMT